MKLAALLLLAPCVAEFAFNKDLLSNFQVDIAAKGTNGKGPFNVKKYDIAGHVQLNVGAEKLHIKVKKASLEYMSGGSAKGAGSELYVNIPAGTFALRDSGVMDRPLFTAQGKVCISGKVSPSLLQQVPPGWMLKFREEDMLRNLEQAINGGFHSHTTEHSGVITVVSDDPNTQGQLTLDASAGTPIELTLSSRHEVPGSNMDVKFSNFVQGAHVGDGFECPIGSATDLIANPEAADAIILLQSMKDMLSETPETAELARMLPNPSALLFEQPVDAEFQPQVLLFLAGGVLGSALVVGFAKIFGRKSSLHEPLMSA